MGWMVKATHRPPYPRERPGTQCIGGWVGTRAGAETLAQMGFDLWTFQTVANRYTD